ncbi:unnamed protein product [Soboliphyme baturini]|uniref:Uncharacterized protein n=1 Tax=Soboliphyme baturini TaxID=241478 RepID=A0A183IAV4_9BILA|nr:unnamed protein product [Soboliphyme baturini]
MIRGHSFMCNPVAFEVLPDLFDENECRKAKARRPPGATTSRRRSKQIFTYYVVYEDDRRRPETFSLTIAVATAAAAEEIRD